MQALAFSWTSEPNTIARLSSYIPPHHRKSRNLQLLLLVTIAWVVAFLLFCLKRNLAFL